MSDEANAAGSDWLSSVYFADSLIERRLEDIWTILLDYPRWNPGFVGAHVRLLRGRPREEGECVGITLHDAAGQPVPEFYAETVKLVPMKHIVWWVYPESGHAFENFLDFGLSREPGGVRFTIGCYSRDRLSAAALVQHRGTTAASFEALARVFREFCHTHLLR